MGNSSENKDMRESFLAAYDEYANAIYRFALLKTSHPETAEDILQDTFTKTWDYCTGGKEVREWKQFLFRVAYNLIVDYYRKKKATSLDALEEEGFYATDPNPGLNAEEMAEVQRVRKAINELPDLYRDIILLRYTEGLGPKEIAEIVGLAENTVSVRIHRGMDRLRKIYEPVRPDSKTERNAYE